MSSENNYCITNNKFDNNIQEKETFKWYINGALAISLCIRLNNKDYIFECPSSIFCFCYETLEL